MRNSYADIVGKIVVTLGTQWIITAKSPLNHEIIKGSGPEELNYKIKKARGEI